MKGISHIFTFLTLCTLGSCMAPTYEESLHYDSVRVDGLIIDENEKPIDHIKVRMEWDSPSSPLVVYSSPKGAFTAELEFHPDTYPVTVSVEISDIDGEENGGSFQTRNDEIIILKENYTENAGTTITYQLTHATSSESSQQSL